MSSSGTSVPSQQTVPFSFCLASLPTLVCLIGLCIHDDIRSDGSATDDDGLFELLADFLGSNPTGTRRGLGVQTTTTMLNILGFLLLAVSAASAFQFQLQTNYTASLVRVCDWFDLQWVGGQAPVSVVFIVSAAFLDTEQKLTLISLLMAFPSTGL